MTDAGFVAAGWLLTGGVLAGYGVRLAARIRTAQAMVDAAEARRAGSAGDRDGDRDRAPGEPSR